MISGHSKTIENIVRRSPAASARNNPDSATRDSARDNFDCFGVTADRLNGNETIVSRKQ
jgi:hypothetical protein